MPTNKNKKLALRKETSLTNVGNQIDITNKILKSTTDVQLPVFGTFTDLRDGNVYKTVKIGEQVWMAENLRYINTYYQFVNNGWVYTDDINFCPDIEGVMASENYKIYGLLYDWDDAKKASPNGWHLPSDLEWQALEICLGMTKEMADTFGSRGTPHGAKLKKENKWRFDGKNSTNTSGFTGLLGGSFDQNYAFSDIGRFRDIETIGTWWTSTEFSAGHSFVRELNYQSSAVGRYSQPKENGYSVRCIRDL